MKYLGLYEKTGVMARPWAEAGYDCLCVDIQADPGVRDGIEFVRADITTYMPPNGEYAFVAAFPPCTHLAGSGARWWRSKGFAALAEAAVLFARAEQIAEWCGCPYFIENPVGRMSSVHKPDSLFDPCDYGGYLDPPGDAYTKKTCLWTGGGFVMPDPRPVFPTEGSRMHLLPPSPDRADLRSVTPEGFARAVFEANSHPKLRRGKVWCHTCGRVKRVDAATRLRIGWPECCGETMTIDSPDERKEQP